ncbi:MAG TPA: DUF4412 domain-containing protein [Blastocatellia bacterium]|nr:DUF4412 domain-containing protein [Blastocatellia bacterium]
MRPNDRTVRFRSTDAPTAANLYKVAFYLTVIVMLVSATACSKADKGSAPSGPEASGAAAGSTGGEFEGAVTMKMGIHNDGSPNAPVEMTYYIKGNHYRIDTPAGPAGGASVIMDLQNGKMTSLMPAQKMYMTMDMKGMREQMGQAGEKAKLPKITYIGKKETIAGYSCEHYLMEGSMTDPAGSKQEMDMCVTKGLGYFGMGGGSGGNSIFDQVFSPKLRAEAASDPEWSKFIAGGMFPLRVSTVENGETKTALEVTKVDRKTLDDSLFTVPAGYKELRAPTTGLGGVPGR